MAAPSPSGREPALSLLSLSKHEGAGVRGKFKPGHYPILASLASLDATAEAEGLTEMLVRVNAVPQAAS